MSFEVQIRIYTIIQIIYTDEDCIEKKNYPQHQALIANHSILQ